MTDQWSGQQASQPAGETGEWQAIIAARVCQIVNIGRSRFFCYQIISRRRRLSNPAVTQFAVIGPEELTFLSAFLEIRRWYLLPFLESPTLPSEMSIKHKLGDSLAMRPSLDAGTISSFLSYGIRKGKRVLAIIRSCI